MKYPHLLRLIVLCLIGFTLIMGARAVTPASPDPLEALVAPDSPLRAGDVLAFHGDYITEVADSPGGYADILKQAIYARRPDWGIRFVTAGDTGFRSVSLSPENLQTQLLTQQPTVVFIFIGNHDIGVSATSSTAVTPLPVYTQALQQEITLIRAAGAVPILATPAVIGEKADGSNPRDALLEIYAASSRKVAAAQGVECCDLRAAFLDYLRRHNPENRDRGILTVDGVYLSPAGNRLVAACAAKSIVSALRAVPWYIPLQDRLLLAGQPVTLCGRGADNRGLDIRYTLDGSQPTAHSPRYRRPIPISNPTRLTIRVQEIATGHLFTSSALLTPTTLRKPDNPPQVTQGLHYQRYDYDATASRQLPDFAQLTPIEHGTLPTPFFFPKPGHEVLGLQMRAYLDVPRDGIYTFFSRAYFGNRLFIGDTLVVDHPFTTAKITCRGQIALHAGKHAIRLEYCRLKNGDSSEWFYYQGPGIPMQMIPETILYRPAD